MDPLSALSIAAAVVQFVEIGGKFFARIWSAYRNPGATLEVAELTKITEQLVGLASGLRESSKEVLGESPASNSSHELVQLCDECEDISTQFFQVLERIHRRRRGKKSVAEATQTALAGLWSDGKITKLKSRLADLRPRVMTAVLFCLWDDAKKAKNSEAYFATQIDDVVSTLRRVEDSIKTHALHVDLAGQTTDAESQETIDGRLRKLGIFTERAEHSTATLVKALEPWMREGTSAPVSAIADEFLPVLNGELSHSVQIRDELLGALWKDDWEIDIAMASSLDVFLTKIIDEAKAPVKLELDPEDPSTLILNRTPSPSRRKAPVHPKKLIQAMSDGLTFEAIEAREQTVEEAFKTTYEWIFSSEPPQQGGKPIWSSFPDWLGSNTDKPFWITGKPGSGKSTIMKFIAHHGYLHYYLSTWSQDLPVFVATYYAWNAGFNMQKSWEGLKRTILHQVLEWDPSLALSLMPRRCALYHVLRSLDCFPTWSQHEVDESFAALMKECGHSIKVMLMVDGLDEFEMPPVDVLGHIYELTGVSADGLKVVAASRPWTEFNDAFNEGPMVQMHVLTQDDLVTFVAGKFAKNKASREFEALYQEQMGQIIQDVVRKAEGVFLWVSLVVNALLDSITEGQSISEIEHTLEPLPSGLAELYDSIWARIPPRHVRDASHMVQLVQAASEYEPLRWFTLWLADESRAAQINIKNYPTYKRGHVFQVLRRRLMTRTHGLLEVRDHQAYAGFCHRTANDWANQKHVRDRVRAAGDAQFEPYVLLLEAERLMISDRNTGSRSHAAFWKPVMRALWYAAQVQGSEENTPRLVQTLDALDVNVEDSRRLAQLTWPVHLKSTGDHWSSTQDPHGSRLGLQNTFAGIAAQFSILPYIQAKAAQSQDLLDQGTTETTIGLFENAVFGHAYYMSTDFLELFAPPNVLPQIPASRRLDTLRFLVDQGVSRTSKVHTRMGLLPIKTQVAILADEEVADSAYFSHVIDIIHEKESLHQVSQRVSKGWARRLRLFRWS